MQRANSLVNFLMMGKIEVRRRRGLQRTRYLDGMTDSMDMSFRKLQGMVRDREVWHAPVYGVTKTCTWLSNWATITFCVLVDLIFKTITRDEETGQGREWRTQDLRTRLPTQFLHPLLYKTLSNSSIVQTPLKGRKSLYGSLRETQKWNAVNLTFLWLSVLAKKMHNLRVVS